MPLDMRVLAHKEKPWNILETSVDDRDRYIPHYLLKERSLVFTLKDEKIP